MSTTEITHQQQPTRVVDTLRRLGILAPAAAVAATAACLGVYYGAGALFPDVTAWAGAGPAQIFGANVSYFLIGAITLLVLVKVVRRPALWFVWLASLGLLFSFGAPISAGFADSTQATPAASVATVVALSLLHLVSYAVGVPILARAVRTPEAK